MKRVKQFAIVLMVTLNILPAQANPPSQLVDLVLEKKVLGDLHGGPRGVIHPELLQQEGFALPSSHYRQPASSYVQTPAHSSGSRALMTKTYRILNDPNTFQSVIQVLDSAGKEYHRISVGRRAKRILAVPGIQRIYVLCGGYFGSVWEIDTVHDLVLRKLPGFSSQAVAWNPSDIAILPTGNTLAIASTTLQLVDLATGQVRRELTPGGNIKHIERVFPLSNSTFGLISRRMDGSRAYHVYSHGNGTLTPTGALGAPGMNPVKVVLRAPKPTRARPEPRLIKFVASRNADFIHMLHADSMEPIGVIPVDFPVDSLLVAPDLRRVFAYHQRFGQISVIELNPNEQANHLSVIARLQDPRFRSNDEQPMSLAYHGNRAYLWDGYSEIRASIETDSLFTQVNIPFRVKLSPPSEAVHVATPVYQRFYLRNNQLFSEMVGSGTSAYPQKIEGLGNHLSALGLSPDQRTLYALDSEQEQLLVVDAQSHQILERVSVGKNPTHLSVDPQGQYVYVLSADEGSISEVDVEMGDVSRVIPLDVGLEQSQIITLFDPNLTQTINIELPRYLTDVAHMAG